MVVRFVGLTKELISLLDPCRVIFTDSKKDADVEILCEEIKVNAQYVYIKKVNHTVWDKIKIESKEYERIEIL